MRLRIVIIGGLLMLAAAGTASAASVFDIEYPIAELGGCADRAACKQYCDDAANADACLAFAQKYGLADQKAVEKTRAVQEEGGPGGCRGEECRTYCDDPGHETECVEYAVQKGFMTREEADRALKPGPGGCRGKACQQYCEDPAHQDECLDFAAANGLIGKEEAQKIREFKQKFKKSETGPGGCTGEEQCRQYCEDPEHITECVSFAEEHGFMDKEQAKIIKKTAGKGPGGCKGSEQCRMYCEDPAHQQECVDFAEQNGFMTAQEAQRARKVIGKEGPGGCRGEACKQFCETPGNEEACLEFAEREGLIPKEEAARARKFSAASRDGGPGGCRGVQCRNYCEDPAHREECYSFAKEKGLISKEEEQDFEAGSKIEEVMRTSGGPGGCRTEDECRTYCTDPSHVEECVAFGATHGGVKPEVARDMLKRFSERRFEARGPGDHGGPDGFGPGRGGFEDFRRFEEEANRRFEEFRALEEQFRGKQFPGFGQHGQEGFPGGGPPEGFPGPGAFSGRPGEFPGGPGENQGQGGFPGGGPAFAGPGGCASPAECIKYCAEHRDECFGGGAQGPSGRDGQGQEQPFGRNPFGRGGGGGENQPGGGPPVRLRTNLIREFKQDELPPGFEQKTPEERQQFFRERIQQERGFGGFEGEQHGPPAQGFPGDPGQFPDRPPREFPGSGEFRGFPGEFPGGPRPGGNPGQGDFPGRSGQEPFPFRRPPFSDDPSREGSGSFPEHGGMVRPEGSPPPGPFPLPPGAGGTGEFFRPPAASTLLPPPGDHTEGGQFPSGGQGGSFPPPPSGSGTFGFPPPPTGGTFSGSHEGSFVPPPPSGDTGGFVPPPPSGSFSPPPPSGDAGGTPPPPPPPPSSMSPLIKFFSSVIAPLAPFLR